jgi:hypothetical protein
MQAPSPIRETAEETWFPTLMAVLDEALVLSIKKWGQDVGALIQDKWPDFSRDFQSFCAERLNWDFSADAVADLVAEVTPAIIELIGMRDEDVLDIPVNPLFARNNVSFTQWQSPCTLAFLKEKRFEKMGAIGLNLLGKFASPLTLGVNAPKAVRHCVAIASCVCEMGALRKLTAAYPGDVLLQKLIPKIQTLKTYKILLRTVHTVCSGPLPYSGGTILSVVADIYAVYKNVGLKKAMIKVARKLHFLAYRETVLRGQPGVAVAVMRELLANETSEPEKLLQDILPEPLGYLVLARRLAIIS